MGNMSREMVQTIEDVRGICKTLRSHAQMLWRWDSTDNSGSTCLAVVLEEAEEIVANKDI